MPPACTIRLTTVADLPAITALYQHNGFYAAQGDPARCEFYFLTVRTAGGEVVIAEVGDAVVGHLELLLCQEAPPLGRYGFIVTLEVLHDHQRRGIGRALVAEARRLTHLAGGTRLEVWTEDDNCPAQALYAATGFQPGLRYRDLELAVSVEAGITPINHQPPLGPGDRPWTRLSHVAGRLYPAAYSWWRAQLASGWPLPTRVTTGAWVLSNHDAVLLADPWFIHLFLPPDTAPDSAAVWPIWQAALSARSAPESMVRTVVAVDLAERLRLLERFPGHIRSDFTLLVSQLAATA